MRTRHPGFSLIELMIAVLIGTLAMVFVMRTTIGFETNRRGSIGGSDSMQNGVVALFSMENDAAQSGWDSMMICCSGVPLVSSIARTMPMPIPGAVSHSRWRRFRSSSMGPTRTRFRSLQERRMPAPVR